MTSDLVKELEAWHQDGSDKWFCDIMARIRDGRIRCASHEPKPRHAGDCTIYSPPENGEPTDGICTCGYAAAEQGAGRDKDENWYSYAVAERARKARVPSEDVKWAEQEREFYDANPTHYQARRSVFNEFIRRFCAKDAELDKARKELAMSADANKGLREEIEQLKAQQAPVTDAVVTELARYCERQAADAKRHHGFAESSEVNWIRLAKALRQHPALPGWATTDGEKINLPDGAVTISREHYEGLKLDRDSEAAIRASAERKIDRQDKELLHEVARASKAENDLALARVIIKQVDAEIARLKAQHPAPAPDAESEELAQWCETKAAYAGTNPMNRDAKDIDYPTRIAAVLRAGKRHRIELGYASAEYKGTRIFSSGCDNFKDKARCARLACLGCLVQDEAKYLGLDIIEKENEHGKG